MILKAMNIMITDQTQWGFINIRFMIIFILLSIVILTAALFKRKDVRQKITALYFIISYIIIAIISNFQADFTENLDIIIFILLLQLTTTLLLLKLKKDA